MQADLLNDSRPHLFIAEAAPGEIGISEVSDYLDIGLSVTVNSQSREALEHIASVFGPRINCCNLPRQEDALVEHLLAHGGCTVLKCRQNFPITKTLISALASESSRHQRLKIIAQSGSGTSHIDLASAERHGVLVTYTPGTNAQAVAEHVLRSILVLTSRAHYYATETGRGVWSKERYGLGSQIAGKTLGLVGMGASATRTAQLAKALGMKVQGFGGSRFDENMASSLGISRLSSFDDLLKSSDVISIHAPLTASTTNLIGAREIQLMRKGALLIHISRGGVVDEDAIAADLASGDSRRLGGVALDVFKFEGSSFKSPLLSLTDANVVLTPHIAGSTIEALAEATSQLKEHVAKLLKGERDGITLASASSVSWKS